jgi:integrase
LAYVTIDARQIWLGQHDTPESRAQYDRIIGEWLVNGRRAPQAAGTAISVSGILAAFAAHARTYYTTPAANADGTAKFDDEGKEILEPSREYENYIAAMKSPRRLYGSAPAITFGPKALKVVRDDLVRSGLCRNVINRRVARIKQIFKWAVSNELIPASVHQALATVPGLRKGKSAARESKPVRPVPEKQIRAVLPHLPGPVKAMVQLQTLTGMRSGELFIMRGVDIDTSGANWCYTPSRHKTQHHGYQRIIPLGPKAQEILRPMLKTDLHAFIFSPTDAVAAMRSQRALDRKTPKAKGNSPGTNRKKKPKRRPRQKYDRFTYRRAIARGCEKAFEMPSSMIEPRTKDGTAKDTAGDKAQRAVARRAWRAENVWHPHRLRHTCGTNVRREFGLDAARQILGHRSVVITEQYAERDQKQAEAIMAKIG